MIDKITEDLRQIYEATENEFNLQVQKGIKNKWSKAKLKEELAKANKRNLRYIKQVSPSLVIETEKINERLYKSALKQFTHGLMRVKKLNRTLDMKDSIKQVTQEGIDKGLKIRAGNRTWSYKTYMEMNARTTLQHEIGEKQLDLGEGKVIFYIVNVFADCADDHKDFQGKVYYDERWTSWNLDQAVKKRIRAKVSKMRSMQDVRENKPYLTTRPNCRHRFNPISIDQALGQSAKTIIKEQKLSRGSYKPDNYKNLQQQRYNERMIRKYKERAEMNNKLGYDNKQDKALIKRWQAKQRSLLNKDKKLTRDYRRESNKILINDLGVKYGG